jgi:hypothetical protein
VREKVRDVRPLFRDDGPKLGAILLRWLDSHRYWVFGYLLVLYLAGFSTHLRYSPDMAKYLLAGRALASDGRAPVDPAIGADLVPGYPWLVAGFEALLGDAATPALLVLMLAVGLTGAWQVYRLMSAVIDRPTAVVVTLIAGANGAVYSNALRPMPDLIFYNGLLLALWGWHACLVPRGPDVPEEQAKDTRQRRLGGSIMLAAGLALMAATRSVVVVVVAAMLVEGCWRLVSAKRWRLLAVLGLGAVAAFAAIHVVQAGFTFKPTPDEAMVFDRLVRQLPATLENALSNTGPGLVHEYIPEAMFGLNIRATGLPLTLLVLAGAGVLWRVSRLWALVVLLFLVQWLLVGATTRYFIPVVPLLGLGWWRLAVYLERRIGAWPGTAVMITLLVLVPGGSVLSSGNTMLQQRSRPFYAHFAEGKYEPLIELAGWMHRHLPEDALVVAGENSHAELALLSERDVRRYLRDADGHARPTYILTPLTQNARVHVERGDAVLGEELFAIEDHRGGWLRLYVLHPDAAPAAAD